MPYGGRTVDRVCTHVKGNIVARQIIQRILDDLDVYRGVENPSEDAQEVKFSLQGRRYEIDLTGRHLDELEELLAPYIQAGRLDRGDSSRHTPAPTRHTATPKADREQNKAVRDWWNDNWENAELPRPQRMGSIPASVRTSYDVHGGQVAEVEIRGWLVEEQGVTGLEADLVRQRGSGVAGHVGESGGWWFRGSSLALLAPQPPSYRAPPSAGAPPTATTGFGQRRGARLLEPRPSSSPARRSRGRSATGDVSVSRSGPGAAGRR